MRRSALAIIAIGAIEFLVPGDLGGRAEDLERDAAVRESRQIDVAHVRAPQEIAPEQERVRMQVGDPARVVQCVRLLADGRERPSLRTVDHALHVRSENRPQREDQAQRGELLHAGRAPQPRS
jgi:hypothetical protein